MRRRLLALLAALLLSGCEQGQTSLRAPSTSAAPASARSTTAAAMKSSAPTRISSTAAGSRNSSLTTAAASRRAGSATPGMASGGSSAPGLPAASTRAVGADGSPPADAGVPVQVRPLGTTPLAIEFRNVRYYRDGIGSLWFFGEVINKGQTPLPALGFYVDLSSAQGEQLARGSVLRISDSVLAPGATGVWLAAMSDHPATWAKVEIQYTEQHTGAELTRSNDTSLQAADVRIAAANPGYSEKVTGMVANRGGEPARVEEIVVALYAADGTLERVAGQGILFPYDAKQVLPAGADAPFAVNVLSYTAKPAHIKVYVRAQKVA